LLSIKLQVKGKFKRAVVLLDKIPGERKSYKRYRKQTKKTIRGIRGKREKKRCTRIVFKGGQLEGLV